MNKEEKYFNLTKEDISKLEIVEQNDKTNCYIRLKEDTDKIYYDFIIDENSKTSIVCSISFYKSSNTGKYTPRLIFKKINTENSEEQEKQKVNIDLSQSNKADKFWNLIGFLYSFKNIVNLDEFQKTYSVIHRDEYFLEFENKKKREQEEDILCLVKKAGLNENDLQNLAIENRKRTLIAFLFLLKDKKYKGKSSFDIYREKYRLGIGHECIWHHFLFNNDWILGLNLDIKFIRDFISENKVGIENTSGSGSPKNDIMGISNYTTLIELKTSETEIFKRQSIKQETSKNQGKGKARANTWAFTSDFIEGVSQCLGQKFDWDKKHKSKDLKNKGIILNQNEKRTLDPKTIFIIGNRNKEFPANSSDINIIKSDTFERYRRNSRNIDIITFDELFERAYHIVFSKKINENWFLDENFKIE